MTYVPDAREALSEFRELVTYGRESPDVGEALSKFLYGGSPPLRADVDLTPAEGAPNGIVVYQLVDELRALLATLKS